MIENLLDRFLAMIGKIITALKLDDYWAADWLFVLVLMWALLCLALGHRRDEVDLWQCVTTRKKIDDVWTKVTDPAKLFETGAFVVMTVGFVHMTIQGKLTEWYAAVYVGAWVANRFRRDREQRLNRILDDKAPEKPMGTS